MVKVVCPQCGTVSEIKEDQSSDEWLGCILPTGFEWTLPAGKIEMATGTVFYIDAFGNKMTREAYMNKYNIDPEVAYKNMRSPLLTKNYICHNSIKVYEIGDTISS